jgi:hypothetical protein
VKGDLKMSETKIAWVAQRPLRGNGIEYKEGDLVPADDWPTKLALQRQGYISAVPVAISAEDTPEPQKAESPEMPSQSESEVEGDTSNRHICHICNREFKSAFALSGHMRSHNK